MDNRTRIQVEVPFEMRSKFYSLVPRGRTRDIFKPLIEDLILIAEDGGENALVDVIERRISLYDTWLLQQFK